MRGLNERLKRRDVFHWLKHKKSSIFFLQETHCSENVENIWRSEWGYEAFFSNFESNSAGVAILFKNDIEIKLHEILKDNSGRFLILDMTINDQRMTLVNIYGYNIDKPDFFHSVLNQMKNLENEIVVMGGDWNVVRDHDLDTYNIKL